MKNQVGLKFKVAVILASFNGCEWIRAQIQSILGQLECDVKIFIRDDCSTDDTVNMIRSIDSHNQVNLIDSKNLATKSACLNFFKIINEVDFSEFDFLALSDQDDIWFPEKLAEGIRFIKKNNADAYSSNLIAYDNNASKSWFIHKTAKQKAFDYLFQGASAGCTYILNADAIRVIKKSLVQSQYTFYGFESHDWIIYAICRSHGLRWVHDDRSFIAYRQHTRNVFGAKPGLAGLISRYQLVKSGWYRSHVVLLNNFITANKFELEVITSVERDGFINRFFLLKNIFSFRRDLKGCIYLALLILLNIF